MTPRSDSGDAGFNSRVTSPYKKESYGSFTRREQLPNLQWDDPAPLPLPHLSWDGLACCLATTYHPNRGETSGTDSEPDSDPDSGTDRETHGKEDDSTDAGHLGR